MIRSLRKGADTLLSINTQFLILIAVLGFVGTAVGYAFLDQHWYGLVLGSGGGSVLGAAVLALLLIRRELFTEAMHSLGVIDVFDNRRSRFDDKFWGSLIAESQGFYRVLGVANHGYMNTPGVKETSDKEFRAALIQRKVAVDLMWLDPCSQHASDREREEGRRVRQDTVESIEFFYALRQQLPDEARSRLTLLVHESTPTCGITWVDDTVVVAHYLAGALNLEAPGLILTGGSSRIERLLRRFGGLRDALLTRKYTENYKEVRSNSRTKEIDAALLEQLRDCAKGPEDLPSEADVRRGAKPKRNP
jgi:hypothetical protein